MLNNQLISASKALEMIAVIESIQEIVVNEESNLISGHLYAQVMDKLSLDEYNFVLDTLKEAGVIEVKNDIISAR